MNLREERPAAAAETLDRPELPKRLVPVEVLAQGFNLLNTQNLQAQFGSGRVGNALSPVFGSIVSARPNFQGELAVRLVF